MTDPREWPPDAAERPSPLSAVGPVLRRWPLVLALALAGGGVGYLGHTWQSPVYESSARLQVSKRFGPSGGDRGVFLEDYVATMTQLIASDAVLGKTARLLAAAPLAAPLPADETAAIDALKRLVVIARVRDPAAAVTTTSTSSVLSLKCVAGDADDSRRILLAVLEAVQWYLVTRHDDAHAVQLADLDRALAARAAARREIEEKLARTTRELSLVTDEELVAVRDRLTANSQRGFALQLELIALDRELKAIADTGPSAEEREAKRRLLLPQAAAPAPADAAPADGPEVILRQLVAGRAELAERLVAGHPRLAALDAQIEHFRGLARPAAPAAPVDELRRHELRLRERKAVAELQRDRIEARVAADTDTLRKGSVLQEKVEALRRQLAEDAAETHRQGDRRSALATAKDSSRAYEAQVLDQPRAGRKVDPAQKVWLQGGFGLGLVLGVVFAFLVEMVDQSYRNPADIRRRLGVPVFGHVPQLRLDPPTALGPTDFDPILVTALRPRSMEAEVYRGLRTRVLVATSTADFRVVQVTSPNPGDGKSTTAANLAVTLAQAGKRVLLMDCDFRRPRVHALFALADPERGLTAVAAGTADLADAVRPCAVPNLFLLPAGPAVDSPSDLLAGARFAAVLAGLRERFDHIVIDSPPLFAVSDSLVLARCVEAVLLVFGVQSRSRPQTLRAKEQLTDTGAVVLGVVVNGMAEPASRYGGYSYGKYGKYGKYEQARSALPPPAADPPAAPPAEPIS